MTSLSIRHRAVALAVSIFVAALAGCDSKQTEQGDASSPARTPYGRAVQKAKDAAAMLSNPKPGIDPVCGMAIDESAVVVTIGDKHYGVCSAECADKLNADPRRYLHGSGR